MRSCSVLLCALVVFASCGDNTKVSEVTVSGRLQGLLGSGLVLTNNGGDDLALTGNGPFSFATVIAVDATYDVAVKTQPQGPAQTCVVTNATGTATASGVSDVLVDCSTSTFTIGGVVSGLAGSGLVLQNNGGDDLAVDADGAFTFATSLESGASFSVTVKSQPSTPEQTCTVSGATGTIGAGPVTTVVVDCAVDRFTVGGTIAGLAGTVVLQNNGADDITVTANGSFAFPTTVASGTSYDVTVKTQPGQPSQTCTVTSGTGTVTDADIASVRVDCETDKFTIGGTVTGLTGTGLVLANNGGDTLSIASDGTFTFTTPVASGDAYLVTVFSQPSSPTQVCAVTAGAGTVGAAAVTDVQVTCETSAFTIGGSISGLTGAGLVLRNNGGDDLSIASDGTFTFTTPVASGQAFSVTVSTQPSNPAQTCNVSGGTGTVGASNVTSVVVNCTTNRYVVGGTISGLAGTVVLQNNGGDDLSVTTNGTFAFSTTVSSGQSYNVTVLTQPTNPSQTCTVANGAGTVGSTDVTVTVTCTTNRYRVGGTVTGLAGAGLVLQNNGTDNLSITANGTFTFSTTIPSGSAFSVTVLSQPTGRSQTCLVAGGAGVIGSSDITTVAVTCTTNLYKVGGTVTGLRGDGLVLQNNGGDDLAIAADGTFSFATSVASGESYAATVLAQPTAPWQTCTVTNGSGTVTSAPITSIQVTCTTNTYRIRGTVSGLDGMGLVLRNNGGDDLAIAADGAFAFATPVTSGASFAVTVATQPSGPTQTCTITGGTGTVQGGDITSVTVNCATNRYSVGGTISGLLGSVTLSNGADTATLTSDGAFAFPMTVASGQSYAVTVSANPATPAQTCVVTNGSGTVTTADITSVVVTCTTNRYSIGGTVTGLGAGQSVVLLDNMADNLTVNSNGSFTFATPVASGGAYSVTVGTQPASGTCTVTNGSGTVTNANVTNVTVTCSTGVIAFGEFRPALKCGDFVNNGNNTQQWCFTLKNQVMCMGAWANDGSCTDTATGIRIRTSTTINWPLRFNPNVDSCLNYNPSPPLVTNLANAIGYASYTIHDAHPGNFCDLSWIDSAGNYVTQPGSGNGNLAEIYDIEFF